MSTILQQFNLRKVEKKEVGIEIEMEGTRLKHPISKYWKGVRDGSLRGASIEYVLVNPVHRSKSKERLLFLKDELKQFRSVLTPSDRCGVHVHINCQDLNTDQVINFALVYLILEDLLVQFCGEERAGNLFCLRASDADRIITGLRICKQQGNMSYVQSNEFRYASMNLYALSKFGSLEFRAFQTPKDILKIQTWIEILLAIKDYSLKFTNAYDILEHISANGTSNFIHSVLGKYTYLIESEYQDNIILESVRRVQEIAYTIRDKSREPSIQSNEETAPEGPRQPGAFEGWQTIGREAELRLSGIGGQVELRPGVQVTTTRRREREGG